MGRVLKATCHGPRARLITSEPLQCRERAEGRQCLAASKAVELYGESRQGQASSSSDLISNIKPQSSFRGGG